MFNDDDGRNRMTKCHMSMFRKTYTCAELNKRPLGLEYPSIYGINTLIFQEQHIPSFPTSQTLNAGAHAQRPTPMWVKVPIKLAGKPRL